MPLLLRLFVFFAVGYSILMAAGFVWQRKMIYLPDREKPAQDHIQVVGLRFWPDQYPDQQEDYRGLVATDPVAEAKGTIIVFHGNAGAAWHRNYYVHALVPLGFNVVLAEYPGYGGRDGVPSEGNFVNDARTTIQLAHDTFGGRLYLWGESLGCGVAAAIAANPPVPVDGVVLVTPWDSLPDLAQSLYWYFPVRWMLRDKFDNVKNLRSFHKPVAVAIAAFDEIIPTKSSLRLYESIRTPKRLWRFENAGHNNWPTDPAEKWWREIMQFVSSAGKEKRKIDGPKTKLGT